MEFCGAGSITDLVKGMCIYVPYQILTCIEFKANKNDSKGIYKMNSFDKLFNVLRLCGVVVALWLMHPTLTSVV